MKNGSIKPQKPKNLGQQLQNVDNKSTKPGIVAQATMGLEYEKHRVKNALVWRDNPKDSTGKVIASQKRRRIKPKGKAYLRELAIAKEAKIINELGLKEYFPDLSSDREYLAKVQKKGKDGLFHDFLGLTFDDNNEMGRLEFLSIGKGILPVEDFLKEENLSNIREATHKFGQVVEQQKAELHNTLQRNNRDRIQGMELALDDQFRIQIPSNTAIRILEDIKPDTKNSGGMIHVTHTCHTKVTPEQSSDFIKALTRQTLRQNFFEHIADQKLDTKNRDKFAPNPKTSLEFIENDAIQPLPSTASEDEKDQYEKVKVYVERWKKGGSLISDVKYCRMFR